MDPATRGHCAGLAAPFLLESLLHPFLRAIRRIGHDAPVIDLSGSTLTWHQDGEPIAQASFLPILWWSESGHVAVWAQDLPEMSGARHPAVTPVADAQLDPLDNDGVHALVGKVAKDNDLSLVTAVPWKGGLLFVGLTEGGLAEGVDVPPPPDEEQVALRFATLAHALVPDDELPAQLQFMATELQDMLVEDIDAPTDPAAVLLRKLILALRQTSTKIDENTVAAVQHTAAGVLERARQATSLTPPGDLLVAVLRWMRAPGGDDLLGARIHARFETLVGQGEQGAEVLAESLALGVDKGLGIAGLQAIFTRAGSGVEGAAELVDAAVARLDG